MSLLKHLKPHLLVLGAMVVFALSSCVRYKNLVYMQADSKKNAPYKISLSQYRIHPNDNLKIEFTSTDPSTSALLNKETGLAQNSQVTNASLYVNSYSVDSLGSIEIPLIGQIQAKGLTLDQLSTKIAKELGAILKLKNVTVKIANYRVSVMGEVKAPGTYYVYNDNTTLLQALSMAGDLTDLANRKRVKLVRNDIENKSSRTYFVDLTAENILESEVYYVFPNDVIYVEPSRVKASRINLPVLQVTLTALSAILLIVNIAVNSQHRN